MSDRKRKSSSSREERGGPAAAPSTGTTVFNPSAGRGGESAHVIGQQTRNLRRIVSSLESLKDSKLIEQTLTGLLTGDFFTHHKVDADEVLRFIMLARTHNLWEIVRRLSSNDIWAPIFFRYFGTLNYKGNTSAAALHFRRTSPSWQNVERFMTKKLERNRTRPSLETGTLQRVQREDLSVAFRALSVRDAVPRNHETLYKAWFEYLERVFDTQWENIIDDNHPTFDGSSVEMLTQNVASQSLSLFVGPGANPDSNIKATKTVITEMYFAAYSHSQNQVKFLILDDGLLSHLAHVSDTGDANTALADVAFDLPGDLLPTRVNHVKLMGFGDLFVFLDTATQIVLVVRVVLDLKPVPLSSVRERVFSAVRIEQVARFQVELDHAHFDTQHLRFFLVGEAARLYVVARRFERSSGFYRSVIGFFALGTPQSEMSVTPADAAINQRLASVPLRKYDAEVSLVTTGADSRDEQVASEAVKLYYTNLQHLFVLDQTTLVTTLFLAGAHGASEVRVDKRRELIRLAPTPLLRKTIVEREILHIGSPSPLTGRTNQSPSREELLTVYYLEPIYHTRGELFSAVFEYELPPQPNIDFHRSIIYVEELPDHSSSSSSSSAKRAPRRCAGIAFGMVSKKPNIKSILRPKPDFRNKEYSTNEFLCIANGYIIDLMGTNNPKYQGRFFDQAPGTTDLKHTFSLTIVRFRDVLDRYGISVDSDEGGAQPLPDYARDIIYHGLGIKFDNLLPPFIEEIVANPNLFLLNGDVETKFLSDEALRDRYDEFWELDVDHATAEQIDDYWDEFLERWRPVAKKRLLRNIQRAFKGLVMRYYRFEKQSDVFVAFCKTDTRAGVTTEFDKATRYESEDERLDDEKLPSILSSVDIVLWYKLQHMVSERVLTPQIMFQTWTWKYELSRRQPIDVFDTGDEFLPFSLRSELTAMWPLTSIFASLTQDGRSSEYSTNGQYLIQTTLTSGVHAAPERMVHNVYDLTRSAPNHFLRLVSGKNSGTNVAPAPPAALKRFYY